MQRYRRSDSSSPPTSSSAMPPLLVSSTLTLPAAPQPSIPPTSYNKMSVQNLVCHPSFPPMHAPPAPSHYVTLPSEHPSFASQTPRHIHEMPLLSTLPNSSPSASPLPPPRPRPPPPPPPQQSSTSSPTLKVSPVSQPLPPLSSRTPSLYFADEEVYQTQQPQQTHPQQNQQQAQSSTHHFQNHVSFPERPLCLGSEPRNSCSEDSTGVRPAPALCVSEPKAKRPWTEQEDRLLRALVKQLGQGLWASIAAQIPGRSGKQVRERWLNHLSPNVTKRPWSNEEDEIIMENHRKLGNCWSRIAKLLEGRSDNSVKNRFYTTLKRRIHANRAMSRTFSGKRSRSQRTNSEDSSELPNQKFKPNRVWE
eukprot:gb/GEZJ01006296.1/.p1 GENE.gb/GEZJ01006296.1/~~gb/GEZJ01006296.1/.p1  ORF type:complete len:364 (+),score=44.05 gb/GEZJ01006296.1/:130-1221(+)